MRKALVVLLVLLVPLFGVTACASEGGGDPDTLAVGYAFGADIGDVGDVLAFRALEEETGIATTTRDLGGAEECVVGLTRGDVQLAQVPHREFLNAVAAGAPVKAVLGQNMAAELVLVGGPGISNVKDLDGKKVAMGEPGGGGDALVTLALEAAGMKRDDVSSIYIGESTTRAAALAGGRADAASLDFSDVALLRRRQPGEYTVLDRAVDRFPNMPQVVWAVASDWAEEHEETLRDVVPALVSAYEEVYGEDGRKAWITEARASFLEGEDAAAAPEIYDFYRDVDFWPRAETLVTEGQHDDGVRTWVANGEIEEAVSYAESWLPDYWADSAGD